MRRVAIVGAGQSGLQLALGLLANDYEVTLVSNRDPDDIAHGPVMSSQCMFDSALQTERALGLAQWDEECPPVRGVSYTVAGPPGASAPQVRWRARLEHDAKSVDQRIKVPAWMRRFEAQGGRLVVAEAGLACLERMASDHDLVVVATGRSGWEGLFERDDARSTFSRPQRSLALTYVSDMAPQGDFPAVDFNVVPGVGEYFVFPALTTTGPCDIMAFEGLPGGPMDQWDAASTPEEHLAMSLSLLGRFLPWEHERCAAVKLTDPGGVLVGRVTPEVRHAVGTLASGRHVLGMADCVVLNDPLTGQGANNAAKAAELYLSSILERGSGPFDDAWMRRTFEEYWRSYAQWVVWWTTSMLAGPGEHVHALLRECELLPSLASTVANGFDDPRAFYPWWFEPAEAERLLEAERAGARSARLDLRDLRRALGQFATGVTVVTTSTPDGRWVGVTANSFTSVSLEPPLVLWCVDRSALSVDDFVGAEHFGVSVLAAHQHHLSRRFATRGEDKFSGVDCRAARAGVPLLEGALARFVCRKARHYDGGDHLIIVGEVLEYEAFEGEPLVFHSGNYRVATRHSSNPW